MNITFRRISTSYRRPGHGINKGIVLADVDTYTVRFRQGKDWSCTCPDTDCAHIPAVAQLVNAEVLKRIEQGWQS